MRARPSRGASAEDDFLWLDTEAIGHAVLRHMLATYALGRDVQWEDLTEDHAILSLIGPGADGLAPEAPPPDEHSFTDSGAGLWVRTDLGLDVLCGTARADELRAELGVEEVSEEAAECLRIESGRPRLGIDMDAETMPQEAGINERAVDFEKGCYVGQETVARLHWRGKPNRHLRGLRLSEPVERRTDILLGEKVVGQGQLHLRVAAVRPDRARPRAARGRAGRHGPRRPRRGRGGRAALRHAWLSAALPPAATACPARAPCSATTRARACSTCRPHPSRSPPRRSTSATCASWCPPPSRAGSSTTGAARSASSTRSSRCSTSTTGTGSGSRSRGSRTCRTTDGALLVSNHSGALPPDAPMIMQALRHEHPSSRPVYMLGEHWFKGYPGVSMLVGKMGLVPAHPANAQRLLRDEGRLVLVFPEGQKGSRKLYWQRYRLRRFGRGGFVRTAMRAGVPIVPIAVLGAEEAMPIFAHVPLLQRLTGLIYFPINHAFPHFGLAAALMYLPAKFKIRFLEPVDLGRYEPEDAEDVALVAATYGGDPRPHPGRARRPPSGAAVGLVRLGLGGGAMRVRGVATFAAVAAAALAAGCGEDDFENEPRPPVPMELSGVIQEDKLTVSPSRNIGAGPVHDPDLEPDRRGAHRHARGRVDPGDGRAGGAGRHRRDQADARRPAATR